MQEVFVQAYFSLRYLQGHGPVRPLAQPHRHARGLPLLEKAARPARLVALEETDHPPTARGRRRRPARPARSSTACWAACRRRDRLVLTLLYLEERSVAEAAEMAGWSQTMVKVQAFRARGKAAPAA